MPTAEALEIDIAVRCDVGPVRRENQDRYMVSDFDSRMATGDASQWAFRAGARGAALAVADGMGGEAGGCEAAELALAAFMDGLCKAGRDPAEAVLAGMAAANSAVHDQAVRDPLLEGMGTTLTAALAREGRLYIGHVGDTRAYLRRGKGLACLTTDHSMLEKVFLLDAESARRHPRRNVLAQCVGSCDPGMCVELSRLALCEGDVLLLCSDGLHGAVSDDELSRALGAADLDAAAQDLLSAAVRNGTADNVTALLARFAGGLPAPGPLDVERLVDVEWDRMQGRLKERPCRRGKRQAG